ncbi:hypothetical protein PM082_015169 [Marasmius tenuissimus]|nr:hypothetical protein PM082_015169 [Marasmius tenuissimus]
MEPWQSMRASASPAPSLNASVKRTSIPFNHVVFLGVMFIPKERSNFRPPTPPSVCGHRKEFGLAERPKFRE